MGVRSIRRNPKKHGMIRAVVWIVIGLVFGVLLVLYLFDVQLVQAES